MKYKKVSEHTRVGWYLGVIAIGMELILGLTYAFVSIKDDRMFGIITLVEGSLALTGLLFLDVLHGKQFDIRPDYFKKVDNLKTFQATILTFGAIILVQFFLQFPLTVRTWHRVFAIWFAAVSEELFFRGVLLAPFFKEADENKNSQDPLYKKYTLELGQKTRIISISLIEFVGITISSTLFAALHYNYYDSKILIIMVLLSGIVLGIAYQMHRNLLSNIIAHLFLNIFVTIKVFGILSF